MRQKEYVPSDPAFWTGHWTTHVWCVPCSGRESGDGPDGRPADRRRTSDHLTQMGSIPPRLRIVCAAKTPYRIKRGGGNISLPHRVAQKNLIVCCASIRSRKSPTVSMCRLASLCMLCSRRRPVGGSRLVSCLLLLPVACGQDPLKALFQSGSGWTLCE